LRAERRLAILGAGKAQEASAQMQNQLTTGDNVYGLPKPINH
jgi:hypothetical protein